jgi:hypothetical protein
MRGVSEAILKRVIFQRLPVGSIQYAPGLDILERQPRTERGI